MDRETRDRIKAELRERATVAATLPEMPSNLSDDEQLAWLQHLLRRRQSEMHLASPESPQQRTPPLSSPTPSPSGTSSPA